MAQNRDFRLLSGYPAAQVSVGCVGVIALTGGFGTALVQQTTGGQFNQVGTVFTGSITPANTGTFAFGTTSGIFLPFTISGSTFAVPAFRVAG